MYDSIKWPITIGPSQLQLVGSLQAVEFLTQTVKLHYNNNYKTTTICVRHTENDVGIENTVEVATKAM